MFTAGSANVGDIASAENICCEHFYDDIQSKNLILCMYPEVNCFFLEMLTFCGLEIRSLQNPILPLPANFGGMRSSSIVPLITFLYLVYMELN